MNWIWPRASHWQSCLLLKLHPTYCPELFMSFLSRLSVLIKHNSRQACKSCSLLRFHLLCDMVYLPSQENEKQAAALSFSYSSLQELVLITHMSSRLRTPCPSAPAFSLQLPSCGIVIYVMYVKMVLCITYFVSQPKAVAFPTNFLAVGVCVSFGNIPIHFMMTVIV